MEEHLHELFMSQWENFDDHFVMVWAEGLTVKETARRLGADLDTATECALADLPPFETGLHDIVTLIGEFGGWTLTLQVLMGDANRREKMAALSAGGGRAVGIGWINGDNHGVSVAADGERVFSESIGEALRSGGLLARHADGLSIPHVDDIPDDEDYPEAAVVTTVLTAIGRLVGRQVDEEWLTAPHVAYLIRG
ncbi:hypothetical protein FDA94_17345 [Herbidospora galbida]|uniref:Uncharacterized protein n=1 Tax=Herbidospora galbida TaxID=2575442 RepID=A0A4U3MG82_9ACTN|nr:hypothetical protein [Herbidospora galbida]TKK87589.1 hypothetical protein FDA94_17345 [Herbidospora galbida]